MMKPDPKDPPPVVGNRNQFGCLQLCLEMGLAEARHYFEALAAEPVSSEFECWLEGYSRHLIRDFMWAAKTGSERGIDQAFALFQNPDYYETRKRRIQQNRRQSIEQRKREMEEQQKAIARDPEFELNEKRRQLRYYIDMYRERANEYELELKALGNPKNVVMSKDGHIQ